MASQDPFTDKQRIASAEAKIAARKRFEEVFPLLVDELISYLRSIKLPENAIEWYKEVCLCHFQGRDLKFVEFRVQHPRWEVESRPVGGGYLPNPRWETIGRGSLHESQYSRVDCRIGTSMRRRSGC